MSVLFSATKEMIWFLKLTQVKIIGVVTSGSGGLASFVYFYTANVHVSYKTLALFYLPEVHILVIPVLLVQMTNWPTFVFVSAFAIDKILVCSG